MVTTFLGKSKRPEFLASILSRETRALLTQATEQQLKLLVGGEGRQSVIRSPKTPAYGRHWCAMSQMLFPVGATTSLPLRS